MKRALLVLAAWLSAFAAHALLPNQGPLELRSPSASWEALLTGDAAEETDQGATDDLSDGDGAALAAAVSYASWSRNEAAHRPDLTPARRHAAGAASYQPRAPPFA